MKKFLTLMAVFAAFLFVVAPAQAKKFVTIGTGGVTGVYYPTGGAIAKMVNKKSKEYGLKATVESTGGSVFNINAVMSGDLEFGIAQSDRQYQAYQGIAEWDGKPQKDLRAVFSIHPEAITLIASADAGIKSINDIKGKKINLGNPGSGQLQNSKDVLEAVGLTENDVQAFYVKAVEAPGLIQDGRIDGFFYTVGHPNGNIKEATSGRVKVNIVPIEGAGIEKLIKEKPYYALGKIDMKNYPNAANADADTVNSIGVKATLVTSAKVSDDIVYAITKEVFENFDEFKTLHPAYSVLTKEDMLQGLSAPIHPGALKYYKEAGLVKYINPELIK
ncbi:TAXI family TRAP transporter solute-binding subunit [Deferribacterales bacterium Es71-Z0220]|uniref:TAXI family TRAP transporter solute-binding subunit n=1 Tax=Deferrivibrio essentukiensis TaxID=2880922 RepID=UPI001F61BCE7|nr:TAXI family TRAP transporter solute-binding subunit [Deferrivibrio essentukiensis]MCB4204840.1 TAXI family TRAP transporter solute-binding subunit [Deferrivibrio essentukiensis]